MTGIRTPSFFSPTGLSGHGVKKMHCLTIEKINCFLEAPSALLFNKWQKYLTNVQELFKSAHKDFLTFTNFTENNEDLFLLLCRAYIFKTKLVKKLLGFPSETGS